MSDSPGSTSLSRWQRFARWATYEWDTPLAVVGGVVAGFSQVTDGALALGLVIGGSVLIVAGGVGAIVNRKRVARVEDEKKAAEEERNALRDDLAAVAQVSKAVYRSLLSSVARELGLTSQERISVYLHDPGLPTFQLLSRYSPNPLLEAAEGRVVYPDDYGLIGEAWRDGWAEVDDLPDPIVGCQQYVAENLARYHMPQVVTEGLAMKSRVLVGLRYPADDLGHVAIGVLIVESLSDKWVITDLRSQLERSEMWYTLQEHLRAQRHGLPKLSMAEGLGF